MTITSLKTLSFEDKIKLLPEKEQSYLHGYVDRALTALKSKPRSIEQLSKLPKQSNKPTQTI